MLTVSQAAEKIGKSEETIRRAIRAGELKSIKVWKNYFISIEDLRYYTATREQRYVIHWIESSYRTAVKFYGEDFISINKCKDYTNNLTNWREGYSQGNLHGRISAMISCLDNAIEIPLYKDLISELNALLYEK